MSYPKVKTVINGTEFNVSSNYRIIKPIGAGAYGIVVSAEDTTTGKRVAIKKIGNTFHDPLDALRILREIKLMNFFGDHENIVALYDMELPDDPKSFEDIYIITELMETDLHKIIYSKQKLTEDHMAYFMYQLLRGMKYTLSADVIHRDLKPSNILLNSNCDLRVCDFGLARGIDEFGGGVLTEYVVTRWYRAPEIMLACRDYTKAVDMWAVGCIFAELMNRKPLFAGTDYMDQLKLITSVIGSPSVEDLSFVKSERALAFMARQGVKPKQDWSKIIKRANPMALDLLDKLLVFNPAKRMTVDEALAHPYLSNLHCPDDEPMHAAKFDAAFEVGVKLEKPALQKLMYEEILSLKNAKARKALLLVAKTTMPFPVHAMKPAVPAASAAMPIHRSSCAAGSGSDSKTGPTHSKTGPMHYHSTPYPGDEMMGRSSALIQPATLPSAPSSRTHIPIGPAYVTGTMPLVGRVIRAETVL